MSYSISEVAKMLNVSTYTIYQREEISPIEIWVECFNKDKADFNNKESNAISMIMAQIPGWVKSGKTKVMGPYSKQRYFVRKK